MHVYITPTMIERIISLFLEMDVPGSQNLFVFISLAQALSDKNSFEIWKGKSIRDRKDYNS